MKTVLIAAALMASAVPVSHALARETVPNTPAAADTTSTINQSRTGAGVRNTEKNMSNTGKNYTAPNTRIDYSGTSTSGSTHDYRSGSGMRNSEINRSNTGRNYTDPNTRIDYSGTSGKRSRSDPLPPAAPAQNRKAR
ncbi:hypothetical protein LJC19_05040 [Oxalobacter sp. OttesenSCG-928-P03]|nr:hypothetical protein [Oxalobacter sp. OttesenSCG-928-P03]